MSRLLFGFCLLAFSIISSVGVYAQTAVVDFESQTIGTVFGGSFGDVPGDVVFTKDGIDVSVETDLSASFSKVTIGGFTDSSFPSTPATISNINLRFDFSNLGFEVKKVTFEYVDFGGDENLGVNDSVIELPVLINAPATLGGASVSVTSDNGVPGTVTIVGMINSITVGGQEFGLDNVVAMAVPEPSAVYLLMLSIPAITLRGVYRGQNGSGTPQQRHQTRA